MRSSELRAREKLESERPAPPTAKKRREPSNDERVHREVIAIFKDAGCKLTGDDDGVKAVRGHRRVCG